MYEGITLVSAATGCRDGNVLNCLDAVQACIPKSNDAKPVKKSG